MAYQCKGITFFVQSESRFHSDKSWKGFMIQQSSIQFIEERERKEWWWWWFEKRILIYVRQETCQEGRRERATRKNGFRAHFVVREKEYEARMEFFEWCMIWKNFFFTIEWQGWFSWSIPVTISAISVYLKVKTIWSMLKRKKWVTSDFS